ncbi:MAG: NAD(P)/FAD-dependent oxidoreductase [Halieaceae bacterium]
MTEQLPVIIAGSGPAGCTLALYLAQQGIPLLLLEREAELPVDLRASTFHPPSLEMLNELGVAAPMIARGLIVERYQYRDRRSGEVAEFDMSAIADETLFPYRLQLEQYELTRIVHRVLAQYDCADIRFEHEVVGFSQDMSGVDVVVETNSGTRTLRGSFLVGADGAGSNVRKAAGIDYSGFTYDERFLVASTSFPFEEVFDDLAWVNYVSDPDEWCVILRTEKLWRVLWPTDPANSDESHYLSDEYLQERLHHLYDKEGDYDIGHRTLYHVHQRVAERYCQGRVVLVGDACHINNPLGGMGMNGGLHDAFNLAQKLTEILLHKADSTELLELYDRQRRELAVQFVQQHTIANKKLMESTDPDVQSKRQRDLMDTASDPARAKAFIMERAMFDSLRESLALS